MTIVALIYVYHEKEIEENTIGLGVSRAMALILLDFTVRNDLHIIYVFSNNNSNLIFASKYSKIMLIFPLI